MARLGPKDDIEISVSPHSHRTGWSTMRVVYPRQPEYEQRVAKAVDALLTPSITIIDQTARDSLPEGPEDA